MRITVSTGSDEGFPTQTARDEARDGGGLELRRGDGRCIEINVCEIGRNEVGICQVGAHQVSALKVSVAEFGESEIGARSHEVAVDDDPVSGQRIRRSRQPTGTHPLQCCSREVGRRYGGVRENGISEIRVAEVGFGQRGGSQIRMIQVVTRKVLTF